VRTHVVFILDRSGSMSGRESDVIGGFNSLIKEQKALNFNDTVFITTVLFDGEYELLHNATLLEFVDTLTSEQYFPRGSTALLDAIGKTINILKSKINKKDKVLFFINTDGEENSSKEYNIGDIKRLISQQKEFGWKFVFLGAGIDAFSNGRKIGITWTYTYNNTDEGIQTTYGGMNAMTASLRSDSSGEWGSNFGDDVFESFVEEE
jgi:uncharacterized protein YegL